MLKKNHQYLLQTGQEVYEYFTYFIFFKMTEIINSFLQIKLLVQY